MAKAKKSAVEKRTTNIKTSKTKKKNERSKLTAKRSLKTARRTSKDIKLGDIIAVPLGRNSYALGKLVYQSRKSSGLVLIRFYNSVLPNLKDIELVARSGSCSLWTGIPALVSGRWPTLGNEPINEDDLQCSKYVIARPKGYGLYQGDKMVRVVSDDEAEKYPRFRVSPNSFVEHDLRKLMLAGE